MNKLVTEILSRMPIVLNDIRFLDNSYKEVFQAFLGMLGVNNAVLYGCNLTDNGDGTFNVSSGAVVINNEVYVCEAHSFACTDLAQAYFIISETPDPEGSKMFGDKSIHDTYLLRKIKAEQHEVQPAISVQVSERYEFYDKVKIIDEINSAIAALVDGSPGALDTLNELSAALGDDADFAATVTNALADKVDKVEGKQLSTEDFTSTLLTKLNAVEGTKEAAPTLEAAWSYSGFVAPRIRKLSQNVVHISMAVYKVDTGSYNATIIANIGAALTPTVKQDLVISDNLSGGNNIISIDTDGSVKLTGGFTTAAHSLYFDCIYYLD